MENQLDINTILAEAAKIKDEYLNVAVTRFAMFFLLFYKNKAENIAAWEECFYEFGIWRDERYFSNLAANENYQKFENMLLESTDFATALEFLAFHTKFGEEFFKNIYPTQYSEIAAARKARQERELEEKAIAFLDANFEKYHNVYKALA